MTIVINTDDDDDDDYDDDDVLQICGGAVNQRWVGRTWALRLRHYLLQWRRRLHAAVRWKHTYAGTAS